MELILIRHAQSQNNAAPTEDRVPDPALTELGWEQAEQLAARAPEWKVDRLYCSPFLRTLQTMKPVCDTLRLKPEVRVDLHEVGGCYQGYEAVGRHGVPGLNRSEILANFEYDVEQRIDDNGWWNSQPYEEHHVALRRAQQLLRNTQAEFGSTDLSVAYVMHADIKMMLLNEIEGSAADVPRNTSVTRLRVSPSRVELIDYNCIAHLDRHLESY